MSADLEEIYKCIYEARVPSTWQKVKHHWLNQGRGTLPGSTELYSERQLTSDGSFPSAGKQLDELAGACRMLV